MMSILSQAQLVVLCVCFTLFFSELSATCKDDLGAYGEGWIQKPLDLTIQENTPADTLLLNITEDDSISMDTDTFWFLKVVNGSVYTAVDIVVDGPENQNLCSLLTYASTELKCEDEGPNVNVARILVILSNLTNDHAPQLNVTPVSVSEHMSLVKLVDLKDPMVATDTDCGTGEITIEVKQDPEMEALFNIDGSVVSVIGPLDYETRNQYTMNVSALSKFATGDEVEQVVGILVIDVLDIDDKNPIFSAQDYSLEVSENEQDLDKWLDTTPPIVARDGDTGINATILYSILSAVPALEIAISETGRIRIRSSLDRERVASYTVIVKAEQKDSPTSSATATLMLTVTDINDNRPRFSSYQEVTATIMEGADVGSHVVWLQAADADEDPNSEFAYILTNGTDVFDVMENPVTKLVELIVRNSSLLVAGSNLTAEIQLNETAPPGGGEECSSINRCVITIIITVIDSNDNTPVFEKTQYELITYNTTLNGSQIGQVSATDNDIGLNALITYSLQALTNLSDCNKVDVDPATGAVVQNVTMIPGTVCVYTLIACDSPVDARDRRCGQAYLKVTVIGQAIINGTAAPLVYQLAIQEGLPAGSLITELPMDGLYTVNNNFRVDSRVLKTAVVFDSDQTENEVVSIKLDIENETLEIAVVVVTILDFDEICPACECVSPTSSTPETYSFEEAGADCLRDRQNMEENSDLFFFKGLLNLVANLDIYYKSLFFFDVTKSLAKHLKNQEAEK